jgi:broad specificity phosphatase PhoE
MRLPPTRNGWTEHLLIDEAFDAYLDWRDGSAEVWHAYKRWNGAPARDARRRFWAYRAALEREEHAARVYVLLVARLQAGPRERAETRRRSHLRPLLS